LPYKYFGLKFIAEASSPKNSLVYAIFWGVAEFFVFLRSILVRIYGEIKFNNADTSNVKNCLKSFSSKAVGF